MRPTAVVLNMFYTGLGIARSLGERGIPVIGLTARRGIYGNYTRYAKTLFCPDSRTEPEALAEWMVRFGRKLSRRAVVFPTRDDDLYFLDRYRADLEPYFSLVMPDGPALEACLDKWETYLWARRLGVPTPECRMVESEDDARRAAREMPYPCVLKPVSAREWRQPGKWGLVGARKAVFIASPEQLLAEYATVSQAGSRVLLQGMVPGGDELLAIAAGYVDRNSRWVASFNTGKVLQVPRLFGTGCIVQGIEREELFEPTARLLEAMRFSGIAEAEFKWDAERREYQLIEINPRPWDQHRLGSACGVDLMYLAYCDHAGLPQPAVERKASGQKWIAEDTFCTTALSLLWKGDPELRTLFRLARGRRLYAIWSARDPLPFLAYLFTRLLPGWLRDGFRAIRAGVKRRLSGGAAAEGRGLTYDKHLEKGKSFH